MHQTFGVNPLQLNKQTKSGHRTDHTNELITDMVTHVFAFQPGIDIACRFVSTTLGQRAVFTQRQHCGQIVGITLACIQARCALNSNHRCLATLTEQRFNLR